MPSYAVVGSGAMAAVWAGILGAMDAVAPGPNPRLAAVGSRAPAQAAAFARPYRVRGERREEALGGAALAVIASAPRHHAEDALLALQAGAAALIEAPLCRTLAEADALVAAADAGASLAYGANLLFAPLVRDAIDRVARLGALHYLEARVHHRPPQRWSAQGEQWGGGTLFDVGPHPLAVLLTLAGADHPVSVQAWLGRAPSTRADGGDDEARVELRLASGARAVLELNGRADAALWDLQVAAEHSVLRLELQPDPHLEQLGVDLPRPPRRYGGVEPAQLELFGYLDQALESEPELGAGRAPYVGVRFGRYVLDVICAAYRSAGTDSPEPLPFGGPRHRSPWELWHGV